MKRELLTDFGVFLAQPAEERGDTLREVNIMLVRTNNQTNVP
jgi:hypothetical protein